MTATQEHASGEIGKDRRRKEDQRLITGRTRWTDNIALPGMLHLAFVRSPYAHARIKSVDVSKALAFPGVHLVLTAADLGPTVGGLIVDTISWRWVMNVEADIRMIITTQTIWTCSEFDSPDADLKVA